MNKKIEKFEDFEVWQVAVKLAVDIYKQLKECRDFSLRDQLQKSAVSVPSNFAEGFDRNSNKEFIQFLYIAKGSCTELRTQLYIAIEVGIIEKTIGNDLIEIIRKISSMLFNLIKIRKEKFN